jgi:hypothetical protein
VAGHPLLPGVVHPHDHQVVNTGQGQQVGKGRAVPEVISEGRGLGQICV